MDNEQETHFTGALLDTRTDEQKAQDWHATELHALGTVLPTFRTVEDGAWKHYQVRSQDGSGSCVANTVAKMLEVKFTMNLLDSSKGETPEETLKRAVKFSHAPIYINRSNKPGAGMIGVNALQIATKISSCKESDMPSENMNDAQLDALKLPDNFEDLNNLVIPSNYAVLPIDFDYIAGMIEKEGCAMIWVNTDYASWCKDIPTPGGKKGIVVHSITGVDTITLGGVQYIVIEDSWGKFGKYNGQRLISREMFNDAVFFGAVLLDFKYHTTDEGFAPFNTVMEFGQTSSEITRYQQLLKARGFFPSDAQCTGYYGNVTARATYLMQVKYNVAPISELNSVMVNGRVIRGGAVRKKTLAVINSKLLTL